jgi:hypothetical protein
MTAASHPSAAGARGTSRPGLERDRLERHADRLGHVVRELRRRAHDHPAPHLIGRAIDGFEAELEAVRKQLLGRP